MHQVPLFINGEFTQRLPQLIDVINPANQEVLPVPCATDAEMDAAIAPAKEHWAKHERSANF